MATVTGPAVVVHHIDHVRRAVNAAGALSRPVTLLSAPNAAATLGPAVFREMVAAGTADAASTPPAIDARIDCGADPGFALRALREGCDHVRIDADDAVLAKLRDIAAASGAAIDNGPISALDLADPAITDAMLRAWLGGQTGSA